jgi:hypothetical protein
MGESCAPRGCPHDGSDRAGAPAGRSRGRTRYLFFSLTTLQLVLVLSAVVLGATALGALVGRRVRHRSDTMQEPYALLQNAMLGIIGLVLAFGLALAVGRYETRRAVVVEDANAIGTTYLRAQTLHEPVRSDSLERLRRYADASIALSDAVPGSADARRAIADGTALQRELWALADQSLRDAPTATAPRLYVDSLNDMIDLQSVRAAGLGNRVPTPVLVLQVGGAAIALGLLAFQLAILGRGLLPVLFAATLVTALLVITFDLDRPTRGLIEIPDTPLTNLRASMNLPPAAP